MCNKEAVDIIESAMREGKDYTVREIANQCGVSTMLAGQCLRALVRGEICIRFKKVVGQTKRGTDKKIFHYRTKQRDLIIDGGG